MPPRAGPANARRIFSVQAVARQSVLLLFVAGLLLAPQGQGGISPNAVAASRPGPAQPRIVYDPSTNTIEVKGPGAVVNLTAISDALKGKNLLERLGPFEWLLKANLKTFELVRLELHGETAGGDVNWLKLRSEPSGYATIESSNGQISIRNTRITSWDQRVGSFDTDFLDGSGRAFIAAKNRRAENTDNRMDVTDSEIAYLGFFEETAYGISWKVISEPGRGDTGTLGQGLTGTVRGSKFHHNYFGLYTWGIGDLEVRNNEFYENYRYGFDAHTVTRRTILEDNFSHHNGSHGIIFAEGCTDNIVRRNRSVDNRGHGIMLHELSDNNVIEDNIVTGNDDGIPVFESSNNIIARNLVQGNVTGVRLYGRAAPASRNLFEDNDISKSRSYGVYMYDAADENTFRHNRIVSNGDAGVYLVSVSNNIFEGNVVQGNEFGIRIDSSEVENPSRGNLLRANDISDNRQYGIYSYPPPDANLLEDNRFSGNRLGEVSYRGVADITPGGKPALPVASLLLLAAIVAVAILSPLAVYLRTRSRRVG
ncbi:MAG: right-handed parallel beta-helix repeat-containing protein [Chloroflexi bacterium]|nr:right-handed parallel beta-helix repeat-containing protein [Chloroflexota bacterium]